jgi:hypothetical protein
MPPLLGVTILVFLAIVLAVITVICACVFQLLRAVYRYWRGRALGHYGPPEAYRRL